VNELSERELAARAGVSVRQVRELTELGVLQPTAEAAYRPSDIQRVRVVQALDRVGISPSKLGQLIDAGAYSMAWAELLFPDPPPQLATSFREAAVELRLPTGLVERLYAAWELPSPTTGQTLRADDAELLRSAALAHSAFERDETVVLGVGRQLGDSLHRLAESQVRLFRSRIQEPLASSGDSRGEPAADRITAIAAPLLAALERTVLLLYRRHLEQQVVESIVLRAELTLEQAGLVQRRPDRPPLIAFLDLTGYTDLTEHRGDGAAADLAARLVDLVHAVSHRNGGRLVKVLGDGAMLAFADPALGVLSGLELVERLPREGLPPARMGGHVGPVVFQGGDYFGRTVNLAARITDYARPGEVLVSDEVVIATDGHRAVRYRPVGTVSLKGIPIPVSLHVASRNGQHRR
jgi:adenylate cyclase